MADVDLDPQTVALAARFAEAADQQDGATIICACCWLIADLVLQAERLKGRSSDHSIALVMGQLMTRVEQLRTLDGEVVH